MTLLRVGVLNAAAVAVRTVSGLALNKILALYVGPAGYALIGQLQSAIAVFSNLGGGALGNGIVKLTAEHFDDAARQHIVWQTAIRISLISCLASTVLLVSLKSQLANWFFHQEDLDFIFIWLAVALPWIGAHALMLAILNGRKEWAAYAGINIAASLISLATVGLLSRNFGVQGALVGAIVSPAIGALLSAYVISRKRWFAAKLLWGKIDPGAFRQLWQFVAMALASAICTPVAHLLIRQHLGSTFGWESAGHWHAMTKISDTYLMLITSTLGTYYLPRIAEIRRPDELWREIKSTLWVVMAAAVGCAIVIYILRDWLVVTLFTVDFLPMTSLFPWQLAGDVAKMASWVLGYVLIGRAATNAFIFSEILFSTTLVLATISLTNAFGLPGVSMAHFANYTAYLFGVTLLVRRALKNMRPQT